MLDYNVKFKSPNQVNTFYDPGPYRSSDHDPVIVGLKLADPSAPAVASTTPDDGAEDVSAGTNITVTFTEPVDVDPGWFDITCGASGNRPATATGGPLTFTIDPTTDFANGESCTLTVWAQNVTDQDTRQTARPDGRGPRLDLPDGLRAAHRRCRRTVRRRRRREHHRQRTGTESGGGVLTYSWDLDDDGIFETPGQSVRSRRKFEAPQPDHRGPGDRPDRTHRHGRGHRQRDLGLRVEAADRRPACGERGWTRQAPLYFGLGGDQGPAIFRDGHPAPASYACGDVLPPTQVNLPRGGRKGLQVRHQER